MKEYLDRDDLHYPFVCDYDAVGVVGDPNILGRSRLLTKSDIKLKLKSLLDSLDEKKVFSVPTPQIMDWHMQVTQSAEKALRRVELFNKKKLLSVLLKLRLESNFGSFTGIGEKLSKQYGKTDSFIFLKALNDVEKIIKEFIFVNGLFMNNPKDLPGISQDIIDHILYMIDDIAEDEGIKPINIAEAYILHEIDFSNGTTRNELMLNLKQKIDGLEKSLKETKLNPDQATRIRAEIKAQIQAVAIYISSNIHT